MEATEPQNPEIISLVDRIAARRKEIATLEAADEPDREALIAHARTLPLKAARSSGVEGVKIFGTGETSCYVSFPATSSAREIYGRAALSAFKLAGPLLLKLFELKPCRDFRKVVADLVMRKAIPPARGRKLIALAELPGKPRVMVN